MVSGLGLVWSWSCWSVGGCLSGGDGCVVAVVAGVGVERSEQRKKKAKRSVQWVCSQGECLYKPPQPPKGGLRKVAEGRECVL
jgi:hypothetical protein